MLVGVPTNIGLGSLSFSSSLAGAGCAARGAAARATTSEQAMVRMVIEILGG
jgi:hypothetical protein